MILWEQFDTNEIYILVMLVIVYSALFLSPKKLPRYLTIFFLVWGFTISSLFDFTIGGGLMDFYKVNDSNQYELFDFIMFFLFAPFSYFFVYFYKRLNIHPRRFAFILYIIGWSLLGLATERISTLMKVTDYQKGYHIYYSMVVFLIVQTTTALYYELIKKQERNQ
ncbi:hypothetical protein [Metabacillus sediminilitoris]|uniref:Uncharacterized protein n=1 Tax=Metabacillus sediminilitoris TaxID=2567941 RepID=A0A4V6RXL7_9BACI|nr:hypothetical protein [Metabacillus sediminilitoris]QGQ44562.1 hypothetical protein GMB29_04365 [Metabacillus sediminilitoris]THF80188.1 hypothetical protein E6W99_10995 [Metabacillus sediminilitoris]